MADVTLKMLLLGQDKGASKAIKDVGDAADHTEKRTGRLGSALKSAGKYAAIGLAGGVIAGGIALAGMAKAAAEDEVGQKRLATALQNTAGATAGQVAATESWISKQGLALGVTDDELRPALGRLAAATHDVGKAQKLASLAMDVSAGSGKSLDAVSTALAKAQGGNVAGLARLGVATKDASGKTLSLQQITKNLADTYGGQAATKANTFQGRMDRLKLVFDEAKESIGAKLLPILTKLATWFMNKGVPAVEDFIGQMKSGEGAGGKFADVLGTIKDVAAGTVGFLMSHKKAVADVAAAYAAFKVAQVGMAAASALSLLSLKAHTVGTIQHAVVSKTAAAASKVWAAGQWLLNAALTANPIGLIVIAIAALVAGLVIAYKHSATFRGIVDGALRAIGTAAKWMWGLVKPVLASFVQGFKDMGKAGTWLWNNALQPAFQFIVRGVAAMLEMWAKMLGALGRVPGFGWAKGASEAMHKAAGKAADMADGIRKIPNSKNTDVSTTGVGAAQSAVRSYRETLDRLPAYIRTQIVTQHTDKFDRIDRRASGGPVRAHSPYLVGENEPELFVPDQNGTILNGAQMRRAAGGTSGGSPGEVWVVIASEDGRELHRKLLKVRRQGGLPLGLG